MKPLYALLILTICFTGLSTIDAPYPQDLWLQHVPTTAILVLIAIGIHRRWLSGPSMLCIFAFVWLHIVGARWIYSFVPYDQWCDRILGFTLSEKFGWTRNHYDRLVHLASGLLIVPPASELLQRHGPMKPAAAAIVSVAVVLAIGAVYEILEWQVAVTLAPRHAEAYNGQQGDYWDPQKDMALAWFGAMVSAGLILRTDYRVMTASDRKGRD